MKITSVRYLQGGLPIPDGGFYPAWWPGMHIPGIYYQLVVVETDEGLTGFGPSSARLAGDRFASEEIIREHILGADPTLIGALVASPYNMRQSRTPPLNVELALWDLMGKMAGQPVSRLLGAYRSQVRAYCSTGSVLSAQEHIEQTLDAYDRGYRAIKLRLHRDAVAADVAVIEAVRAAAPADMAIMADANQTQNPYWSRREALYAAQALEAMDLVWLEEPLPIYDLDGLAELASRVDIPIAAGESQYLLPAFRRIIDEGAADILQPDLNGCGGLLEYRKIAALAEAHVMEAIPHLWSNGLMMACILQAIASVPNASWAECTDDMLWPADIRDSLLTEPFVIQEGMIDIPSGPGWGVELDWDRVVQCASCDVTLRA